MAHGISLFRAENDSAIIQPSYCGSLAQCCVLVFSASGGLGCLCPWPHWSNMHHQLETEWCVSRTDCKCNKLTLTTDKSGFIIVIVMKSVQFYHPVIQLLFFRIWNVWKCLHVIHGGQNPRQKHKLECMSINCIEFCSCSTAPSFLTQWQWLLWTLCCLCLSCSTATTMCQSLWGDTKPTTAWTVSTSTGQIRWTSPR